MNPFEKLVEDTREEVRTWLGTNKEPITEHTNPALVLAWAERVTAETVGRILTALLT